MTLATLILALAACDPNAGPAGECTDHGMCGEMQACVDFSCVDVECLANTDCPLQHFCDTAENSFTCKQGCLTEDDCAAGEECSAATQTCEAYGCRSTELDCPVGQTCNEQTGQCNEVADLCTRTCDLMTGSGCGAGTSCQVGAWGDECQGARDCEAGWGCDMFLVSHDECYTNQDCSVGECYGAIPGLMPGSCVLSYCHMDYCFPNCQLQDPDCPAGFSCEDVGTGGACWGACDWYIENGYL